MAEPFARSATGPQLQTRIRAVHRLAVSALGLFIGAGIYAWAVLTELGQQVDASSLALGENLRAAWGEAELARAADVAPWIIIAPAVVVLTVCALRGRWVLALTTAALPVATYAVATALHDYLLPRPYLGDFGHDINTLPSERLAVAIACCVVLASLLPAALPRAVLVPVLAFVAGGVGSIEVAAFSSRSASLGHHPSAHELMGFTLPGWVR